jgi:3-dehydroquinate dehydratase-1
MNVSKLGHLTIGRIPRVVGTLSSLDSLHRFPSLAEKTCDIAEIRLDQIGEESDWMQSGRAIEQSGTPVILTLRNIAEGGKCSRADEERALIFEQALSVVSAIDVEFASGLAARLFPIAKQLSKAIIVSYHDFSRTPGLEKLEEVISQASPQATIVKVSTMIKTEADIQVLQKLLLRDWGVPICVIGMGSLGTATRVSFPSLGSALTYGYLDVPSAPGQLPARALVENLSKNLFGQMTRE